MASFLRPALRIKTKNSKTNNNNNDNNNDGFEGNPDSMGADRFRQNSSIKITDGQENAPHLSVSALKSGARRKALADVEPNKNSFFKSNNSYFNNKLTADNGNTNNNNRNVVMGANGNFTVDAPVKQISGTSSQPIKSNVLQPKHMQNGTIFHKNSVAVSSARVRATFKVMEVDENENSVKENHLDNKYIVNGHMRLPSDDGKSTILQEAVMTNDENDEDDEDYTDDSTVNEEEEDEEEEYYDDEKDNDISRSRNTTGNTVDNEEFQIEENITVEPNVNCMPMYTMSDKMQLAAIEKDYVEQIDPLDISMVPEYADDIFKYMKQLERKFAPNPRYMEIQKRIEWCHRAVLIDWLVQVHARFHLLPETLFLCVNIIDRFLSIRPVVIDKLQLVGVTALLIASKYEEITSPSVSEIIYMTDNKYDANDVLQAERFMISILAFEFGWPGPLSFLRRISKADDFDVDIRTVAKYLLEVTLMDQRFVGSPPSYLAAACHCLSCRMLGKPDWVLNFYKHIYIYIFFFFFEHL